MQRKIYFPEITSRIFHIPPLAGASQFLNSARGAGPFSLHPCPAMGRTVKRGRILGLLFFLHIKNGLGLCFLVLSLRLVIRLRFWLAFSGSAQAALTWLNLLSVQPQGAHIISSPRSAREAHGTHSLQRAIKSPGAGSGSVTLQNVAGKIIRCSSLFQYVLFGLERRL